jgi:hypothetical protein
LGFLFDKGFRVFRVFCGYIFVIAFRDGSAIIASVRFDREHCSWALSALRFNLECDNLIWWLLGVFGVWINLVYDSC